MPRQTPRARSVVWLAVLAFACIDMLATSGRSYTTVVAHGDGREVIAVELTEQLVVAFD